MTQPALQLPPGIDDARFRAFAALVDRLDGLPIEALLVRRLATVPPAVLPALAWELGVLDSPGWRQAGTDAAGRRTVIADAVRRHRRAGTPWALRRALQDLGWPDAQAVDAPWRVRYDGAYRRNGVIRRTGGRRWWEYAVHLGTLPALAGLTPEQGLAVQQEAARWAPARARLVDVVVRLGGITTAIAAAALPPTPLVSIARLGVGTGSAAGLVPLTGAFVRSVVGTSQPTGSTLRYDWRLDGDQAVGVPIRELALLTATGTLVARVVRPVALVRAAGISLEGSWTITIT